MTPVPWQVDWERESGASIQQDRLIEKENVQRGRSNKYTTWGWRYTRRAGKVPLSPGTKHSSPSDFPRSACAGSPYEKRIMGKINNFWSTLEQPWRVFLWCCKPILSLEAPLTWLREPSIGPHLVLMKFKWTKLVQMTVWGWFVTTLFGNFQNVQSSQITVVGPAGSPKWRSGWW